MARPTKQELQPTLSGNGFDNTERSLHCLQNRTLLDVKFHVAQNIVTDGSRWNLSRIQPKILDGLAHGNSPEILTLQKFFIDSADQCPAADEWRPKADSFFFRKANDFNPEGKPLSLQSFEQRDSQYYPENSIEGPGVRDRVEMRAQQQSWSGRVGTSIEPAKISGIVDLHFGPERRHPGGDFPVAIMHGR